MQELLIYCLMFAGGFFVKLADFFEDELHAHWAIASFAGIAYGLILGYVMHANGAVAALVIGAIVANMLCGHFDRNAHWLGAVVIVFVVVALGLAQINIFQALIFLIAAIVDEHFHFRAISNPHWSKTIRFIFQRRLVLDFTALAVSVALMESLHFIAIVMFDMAYQLTEEGCKKIFIGNKWWLKY